MAKYRRYKVFRRGFVLFGVFCYTLFFVLTEVAVAKAPWKSEMPDRKRFAVSCQAVKLLDARLNMIPPIGPASGPAHFMIGGRPELATATVQLLGPPMLSEDGSAEIMVQIQYDFGGGDVLLAFSKGILHDSGLRGVFINNAMIGYMGGSGRYEKAYGRFQGAGVLNFEDFLVEMQGKGEVCNIK